MEAGAGELRWGSGQEPDEQMRAASVTEVCMGSPVLLQSLSLWVEIMSNQLMCMLKFLRGSTNQRMCALFAVTFKLMFLVSIMVYWMAESKYKDQLHSLPLEVKCPLVLSSPPPLILGEPPTPPGDIFFVETSDRTNPSFLFMCSVESASRTHPGTRIIVLMKGLVGRNSTLPKHLGISLLSCFSNVEFQPLDLIELFEGTPLASWYSSLHQRWQPYLLPILSDAARIAIMWKFGGIYLDTDFIVLKNLKNFTNVLGTQSKYVLNGAFLAFEPRHKFIQLCMQDFVDHYNGWIWGHQGPQLLTRVFKEWCGSRSLQDRQSCKGVQALPREAFYPITWQNWKKYFEAINLQEYETLLSKTYAVHIWNTKSQSVSFEVTSEVLLARLYSQHCPMTSEVMKMYL
ncbi:lactosylceramide 4-alpha-galactosyltransferase [Phascolarctos cinereus]|uniref:Lactosylceramide 4-alpha-galactosyltransferase n=1 Tax=Phascolarctos cinereus TaxID=38626 RepID=A0A6P5K019_PHACI|nr:lactosylceramide 4-alpha-galactosyltransferase [Phascolarctos cinereus]